MRRQRRQFETPKKAWYEPRIKDERKLISKYGLKNKKEVWKAESKIRKWRREARKLTATANEHREEELMQKLQRLGLVSKDSTLDEVLELGTEDILQRRLQTVVRERGLAETVKQARQFIVHGHISINGDRVTIPSYVVRTEEEPYIQLADHMYEVIDAQPPEHTPEPDAEPAAAEQEESEPVEEQEDRGEDTEDASTSEDAAAVPAEEIVSGTVGDAKKLLENFAGNLENVLEAEKSGKNRVTLVEHIEALIEEQEGEE